MPDPTRPAPRAPLAILGARTARRHLQRTGVIARQLHVIAPGTVHVRTVPVRSNRRGEFRLATHVALTGADGRPVAASVDAHRAVKGFLTRMFPAADWSRPLAYDARTGRLAADEPAVPAALSRAAGEVGR
ncbi:hypothetical protein [Streptomyces sp. CC224B]|uniref:hypothetical protein n=1 Tax=Streptomyces sp. CC224B TaxID=3044571 RepID=UPI0024A9447A|nr:hypothetical protein [Streptomyces sp. CC224B]